jgi:hypothetical protein
LNLYFALKQNKHQILSGWMRVLFASKSQL